MIEDDIIRQDKAIENINTKIDAIMEALCMLQANKNSRGEECPW